MSATIQVEVQMPPYEIDMARLAQILTAYAQSLIDTNRPCNYSVSELRQYAQQAIDETTQGIGTPHEDVKRMVASWRR
jgi:hypothetical protein